MSFNWENVTKCTGSCNKGTSYEMEMNVSCLDMKYMIEEMKNTKIGEARYFVNGIKCRLQKSTKDGATVYCNYSNYFMKDYSFYTYNFS